MCLCFLCEASLQAVESYGTWYAIRGNLVDRELTDIETDSRWGRNGKGRATSRKDRSQPHDWTRAFHDVPRSNGMILEQTGPGVLEGYEILMRTILAEGGEAAVWHKLSEVGMKVGWETTDWQTREVERREFRPAVWIAEGDG